MKKDNPTQDERRAELREKIWPDLDPRQIWDRTNKKRTKGFITIPRCMSLILDIMDQMSSGNPLSSTYFALWCHVYDQSFVEITSESEMAFESGFKGQRALTTWKGKMKKLKDLGFIDIQKGLHGDFNFVLIFNPFKVIKDHCDKKTNLINRDSFNALAQRAQKVGARDLEE